MIDPISPCHRMIPSTKVNRNPRKNSCQSDIRRPFHHRSIALETLNANGCGMVSPPTTHSNWVPLATHTVWTERKITDVLGAGLSLKGRREWCPDSATIKGTGERLSSGFRQHFSCFWTGMEAYPLYPLGL